ncbi:hypothetical protein CAPTEDRAFT_225881 [Capitella teleta]|uniref:Protection of telomeres protein 1 n=1 Tax=Capitella teleta TaxID=283909 RepID=R7UBK7_CAPTE|nr:hypothetical protein CAPTEDRAFT_225881 [Capitella teleta]|eukprot:ELU00652.1 hypothetical protein CAPTEDRAFT_225881 [Capitella teleta]
MPFFLTSEKPDELVNLLPENLRHLPLDDISNDTETDQIYIRAQISFKGPYQKSRKYFKASLVEGNFCINAFFYDKIAEFCLTAAIGDTIAISKMRIEKNTRPSQGDHACQLIVNNDACVWACVEKPPLHNAPVPTIPRKVVKYTYTKLADLKPKTKANVWGVVRFFKSPTRSRGSDYNLFLTLVDPSIVAVQSKLRCSFFARTAEGLPEVQRSGDIVRIHRLEIQQHNDHLVGGNSPGISFLAFDGSLDGVMTPRTSSSSYTMTPDDEAMLHELRAWIDSWQGDLDSTPEIDSTTPDDPSQNAALPLDSLPVQSTRPKHIFTSISKIRNFAYCNLVVAKAVIAQDCCVLLRVWDGTKATQLFHEENQPDRLELLNSDEDLVCKAGDKMVDIWAFDNHFASASQIELRSFISVINLHASQPKSVSPPRIELTLHGGTSYGKKIEKLDNTHPEVEKLVERINEWELSFSLTCVVHDGHLDTDNPAAATLPCHAHQPISSLQQVQNHQTPYKFRVRVKVLELSPEPTKPHSICQIYCHECHFLSPYPESLQCQINDKPWLEMRDDNGDFRCPTQNCNSQIQTVFMMKLLLHDGDSSLRVGLWGNEAVKFLHDFSPSDVLLNEDLFASVSRSLLEICPKPTQTFDANRPWIECCVMSFSRNTDKKYLIFDTQLNT